MRAIAIILIVIGVLGLFLSTLMFGDIGISAAIGYITAILSGVGFLQVNKRFNN